MESDDSSPEEEEYEEEEAVDEGWAHSFPFSDGYGKQYDLTYSNFFTISSSFPLQLPKLPFSSQSHSPEEYLFYVKHWHSIMSNKFSKCILSNSLSLFYHRPHLGAKVFIDQNNFITSDQISEIEDIVINNLEFNRTTFFQEKIRCRSNLVANYLRVVNQWPGWPIPPFPDPNIYDSYNDFFIATSNWYDVCAEIMNEHIGDFIQQSEEKDFVYPSRPWSLSSRKKRNQITKALSQMTSVTFNTCQNVYNRQQQNNSFRTNNFNENNSNINDNTNNSNIMYKDSFLTNDCNVNNINNRCNNKKNVKFIEPQDDLNNNDNNIEIDPNLDSITLKDNEFDFLSHPIMFNIKYDLELAEEKKTYFPIMNNNNNDYCMFYNEKNAFFSSLLRLRPSDKGFNAFSGKIKKLHNSYLNGFSMQFPVADNSVIFKLINYGCTSPIKISHSSVNYNDNKSNFLTIKKLAIFLELDVLQIPLDERLNIYDFVVENYQNIEFLDILNSTQFLFKITVILSIFTPVSIRIINPEFSHFPQMKEEDNNINEIYKIHHIFFQWHFSDVIAKIFNSLKQDEISLFFVKRSNGIKEQIFLQIANNSFPFIDRNNINIFINENMDVIAKLLKSIFLVSFLLNASKYVFKNNNSFDLLKHISEISRPTFHSLCITVLTNTDLCYNFISEIIDSHFLGYEENEPIVNFISLLFQTDPNKLPNLSSKITNFEWVISNLSHIAKFLNYSLPHVFMLESHLKFVTRIVKRIENSNHKEMKNEWDKCIYRIHGMLYAFLPFEKNQKILASELRSFSLCMWSKSSSLFFNSSEHCSSIFQYLNNENSFIVSATWSILRRLFISGLDNITNFLQFDGIKQNIIRSLANPLTVVVWSEMIITLTKLIDLAIPIEKEKVNTHFSHFPDGLISLFNIMKVADFRPIKICSSFLKNPNQPSEMPINIGNMIKFYCVMLSHSSIKKMFDDLNFDPIKQSTKKKKKVAKKRINE